MRQEAQQEVVEAGQRSRGLLHDPRTVPLRESPAETGAGGGVLGAGSGSLPPQPWIWLWKEQLRAWLRAGHAALKPGRTKGEGSLEEVWGSDDHPCCLPDGGRVCRNKAGVTNSLTRGEWDQTIRRKVESSVPSLALLTGDPIRATIFPQSAANHHGSLWEEVLPGANAQKGRFSKAVGFRVEGLLHSRADGWVGRGWAPLDGVEVPPPAPRCLPSPLSLH